MAKVSMMPDFEKAHLWYDANAEEFARRADTADVSADRAVFRALLPQRPGLRVLDAGCGSGRDLSAFQEQGLIVTGLDPSSAMIAACRARLAPGTELRQAGLDSFHDEEGSWDGIWCMASHMHLPLSAQPDVLGCLVRSLAPDGVLMAWIKQPTSGGAQEVIDGQGRPMSLYGAEHAEGLLALCLGDLPVQVDVSNITSPDSAGRLTGWTQVVVRMQGRAPGR